MSSQGTSEIPKGIPTPPKKIPKEIPSNLLTSTGGRVRIQPPPYFLYERAETTR